MKRIRIFLIQLLMLSLLVNCSAPKKEAISESDAVNYLKESEADKDARMEWWREARFGMFIHWGPSATLGGEWKGIKSSGFSEMIQDNLDIPIAEYETLAPMFNPQNFDAEKWVSTAKEAGMKYIVFTSKHVDGFAMWDSEYSDWDIGGTPFKKVDPIKELQIACEEAGIRLCFYHAIMDWHNMDAQGQFYPDYNVFPQDDSVRASPTLQKYVDEKLKFQIKELLTNYGDIGVLWFDAEWINGYTTQMGKEMYQYVRELQPNIIINNRVDKGRHGSMTGMNVLEGEFAGDYGTPEQEVPETGLTGVHWETCQTMNDSWGYKHFDHNWKSDTLLIRQLIDIASKGGNYLLNVGPTGDGVIPEPSVQRLKKMGEWMNVNGESIYGTTASPIEAPKWGRITQKGDVLYAHVFDWPEDGKLAIELKKAYSKATLLATGENIDLVQNREIIEIKLPKVAPDGICSVLKIE